MENKKRKLNFREIGEYIGAFLEVLSIFVAAVIITIIIYHHCSADSSLGLIGYGDLWLSFGATGDSSYSAVSEEWTFSNINEDVDVIFPNYGIVRNSSQPILTFNKLCNYSVTYDIGNPNTGETEHITYNGQGFSCRPIKDYTSLVSSNRYIYDLRIFIENDPNIYNDELFGTWDLPQFLSNTSAFQGGDEYGYFDIEGEISNPNGTYYSFYEMRFYYDVAGDFINLYVTTNDAGEIRIISSNEAIYRYLTITDAPSGVPNRLLVYLQDNAINLDSQGLSVSIGGVSPNNPYSYFESFLYSVRYKINDLQTMLDSLVEGGTNLWSYIVTAVDGFFSLNIGGITLGAVFGTLLSLALVVAFLKLFLGG